MIQMLTLQHMERWRLITKLSATGAKLVRNPRPRGCLLLTGPFAGEYHPHLQRYDMSLQEFQVHCADWQVCPKPDASSHCWAVHLTEDMLLAERTSFDQRNWSRYFPPSFAHPPFQYFWRDCGASYVCNHCVSGNWWRTTTSLDWCLLLRCSVHWLMLYSSSNILLQKI